MISNPPLHRQFEWLRPYYTVTNLTARLMLTLNRSSNRTAVALDLSASGLWSHLNYWGQHKEPLAVVCDESKPLRSIAAELSGDAMDAAMIRARMMKPDEPLGWEMAEPVKFADSRAHPSIQLADILASTVVYCHTNGMPQGFKSTAHILDEGMLKDSIFFPDLERVQLNNDPVKVHYAVLLEMVAQAEGGGMGILAESYFELAEQAIASGELVLE